ncbi:MAG: hypothetical protein L0216_05665 [Planctomycetales bacterium]|nr:hypothetical protein [Planctomycetales bacterium]
MTEPSPTRNERLRAWKKRLKPPRAVRRPLLYLALLAGVLVLGAEVVEAIRRIGAGA